MHVSLSSIVLISLLTTCKVSSSEYKWIDSSRISGRSLIYSVNNKGPNMDPCGTPTVIDWVSELYSCHITSCDLLSW